MNKKTPPIVPQDTREFLYSYDNETETLPYHRQIGTAMFAVSQICGRPHAFDGAMWNRLRRAYLRQETEKRWADYQAPQEAPELNRDRFREGVELVASVLNHKGKYAGEVSPDGIARALNDAGHRDILPAHVRAAKAGR